MLEAISDITRPPPPPNEIILFGTAQAAGNAAFLRDGRHMRYRHVRAWWPGRGLSCLLSARYQRVTVDSSIHAHLHLHHGRSRELNDAVQALRTGQQVFGEHAVWIGPQL